MRIRTKRVVATFAGLVMLGVMAHTAVSDNAKVDQASAGAGGAETAAMMEAMMKAGTPGAEHKTLAAMTGKYDAEVTMKMAPDAPEMKSKGKETNEMILGGRYIKSDYAGDMMGMPFNGTSLSGYDNTKKKFVSVWADSMSTSLMVSEGTADASGKVITFTGECPCPTEGGKLKAFRQVMTITDADHHEMDMYSAGPDGKEFRGMHIAFTRAK
jgi:hypothetical protein